MDRNSPRRRDSDLRQPTLFLISDVVALATAFLWTYYVRFSSGWLATPLGIPPFLHYLYGCIVVMPAFLGIFYAHGLYDPARRKSLEEDFAGLLRSVILGSMLVLALAFFIRQSSFSRTFFALFFASSLCLLCAGRVLMRSILRRNLRRGVGVVRALILGDSAMRERLLETFRSLPGLGIVPVGLIQEATGPQLDGIDPATGLSVLGDLAHLEQVVLEHDIDAVLLTLRFEELAVVTEIAERLGPYHVDVQFVPDMQRIRASRMRLQEIAGVPFISVREGGLSGIDRIVKRSVDIAFSALSLFFLSPLLLLLATLVKLSSRGPVIYAQERLGRDHMPFRMLKFRTMQQGAERDSGPVITIQNDPRRTIVGSFLRRFSLDELPQLWNVLRGDMSLVGPRPERAHFAEQFHGQIPRYLERHRVRSGLTGWAQVHGLRGNTPVELRTLYDLHYVENWSLELDMRILLRTFLHVLRGENAY